MALALAISSVRAMRRSLLLWYRKNKRDLPWRRTLRQRLFRASLLKKGRRLRLPLFDQWCARRSGYRYAQNRARFLRNARATQLLREPRYLIDLYVLKQKSLACPGWSCVCARPSTISPQ